MDPVVADYMLLKRGFPSFQTAFGDNLLTSPEVSDAIRINKAFIVQRGLEPLAQLKSSMTLSRYIRETIYNKDSVWIAQREGRAKDGDEWQTLDMFDGNRVNETDRIFTPAQVRYVRLFVVGPTQGAGNDATRIYTFDLW